MDPVPRIATATAPIRRVAKLNGVSGAAASGRSLDRSFRGRDAFREASSTVSPGSKLVFGRHLYSHARHRSSVQRSLLRFGRFELGQVNAWFIFVKDNVQKAQTVPHESE